MGIEGTVHPVYVCEVCSPGVRGPLAATGVIVITTGVLAAYILDEPGALTREEILEKFKHAISPGFDPAKHLKKIGIANQTTMYKKETQAIGKLFEKVMMKK